MADDVLPNSVTSALASGRNLALLKTTSFPLRKGPAGYFATDTGPDALSGIIEQVLGTVPGERVMRPTFGCDVHRHLFAPADQREAALVRSDIADAIAKWVPWIVVPGGAQGVDVTIDGHVIDYVVRYQVSGGPVQTADGQIQLRKRG